MKKLVSIHKQIKKGVFAVAMLFMTQLVYAQNSTQNPKDTTKMELSQLHTTDKGVSALSLFKGEKGITTALQIKANQTLKEHTTPTPALLVCVSGEAKYFDENKTEKTLQSGSYVMIAPNVKHWIEAATDSQFLLIK